MVWSAAQMQAVCVRQGLWLHPGPPWHSSPTTSLRGVVWAWSRHVAWYFLAGWSSQAILAIVVCNRRKHRVWIWWQCCPFAGRHDPPISSNFREAGWLCGSGWWHFDKLYKSLGTSAPAWPELRWFCGHFQCEEPTSSPHQCARRWGFPFMAAVDSEVPETPLFSSSGACWQFGWAGHGSERQIFDAAQQASA